MFGGWIRELRYFGFAEAEIEGIPLVLARSGWSKQGGYELYLRDGQYGARLWQLVKQAGASYGIGPGAPNYIERVESGLISYGADTDDATTPYELGMDKFIDVDQEQDFVGKAALRALRDAGVKRRFMGLLIDGDPFPTTNEARWKLLQNGDYVGYASAAAYSPRVQSNIAVAMVSVAAIESGQPVDVACNLGDRTATIVPLPIA
jgi:aminomethyltransferase